MLFHWRTNAIVIVRMLPIVTQKKDWLAAMQAKLTLVRFLPLWLFGV
jgi:hypothetical protein